MESKCIVLNEVQKHAVRQMQEWLAMIYPPNKVDRALKIEKDIQQQTTNEDLRLMAKIWTFTNEYSIVACIRSDNQMNYLGCQALSRKMRTGETWNRGNDLADGDFTQTTWNQILNDIVRYESEEIRSEKWKTDYKERVE